MGIGATVRILLAIYVPYVFVFLIPPLTLFVFLSRQRRRTTTIPAAPYILPCIVPLCGTSSRSYIIFYPEDKTLSFQI